MSNTPHKRRPYFFESGKKSCKPQRWVLFSSVSFVYFLHDIPAINHAHTKRNI